MGGEVRLWFSEDLRVGTGVWSGGAKEEERRVASEAHLWA